MYIKHNGVKVPTTFQQNKPSWDSIWKNNLEFPGLMYKNHEKCSNQKEHVGAYEKVPQQFVLQKNPYVMCHFFYPQINCEWWYKFRALPQVYPFHLIQCNFISLTTNSQAKVLQQPLGCDSVTGVDRCERCPQNLNLCGGNHPADVCWYGF